MMNPLSVRVKTLSYAEVSPSVQGDLPGLNFTTTNDIFLALLESTGFTYTFYPLLHPTPLHPHTISPIINICISVAYLLQVVNQ